MLDIFMMLIFYMIFNGFEIKVNDKLYNIKLMTENFPDWIWVLFVIGMLVLIVLAAVRLFMVTKGIK